MQAVRVNMASMDIERYGSTMLEAAQEQERLALRLEEPRLIFLSGMGLATGQAVLGMVDRAALTGDRLLAMTENALPTFRVHARVAASYGLTLQGELERSAALLAEAVTLEPEPGVPKMLHQPSWCRILYAYSLSLLGRFGESDRWTGEAVEIVDASEILPSRALVAAMAAEIYALRGELARAAAHNRRAEELQMQFLGESMNRTRSLASWLAFSIDGGAAELDAMEALPFQKWTAWPALLVTAQRRAGRFEQALRTIDATLHDYAESGAGLVLAELHRERGEIALAQATSTGDAAATEQAETQFREALRVARHQSAKLFELRATNALTRLLERTGRGSEAKADLQTIADAFRSEEGPDLAEARTLLASLAG